jgi:signal transduction histidine kinase/PAS domain-containing protein
MNEDWIYSEVGQRVLGYALDPRPVWFWNEDGSVLIWRNLAAKLFRSKFKKKGLKFLPDPIPLKGQVSRLIKLGSNGRASVSRMRFRMGKKPVSSTCSCIPLHYGEKQKGLLVISTDAIDLAQFDGDAFALVADEQLFEPAQNYAIVSIDDEIVAAAVASGEQDQLDKLLSHSVDELWSAAQLDVRLKAGATLLMLDLEKLNAADNDVAPTPVAETPAESEADILPSPEVDEDSADTPEQQEIEPTEQTAEEADEESNVVAIATQELSTQSEIAPETEDEDVDLLALIDQLYPNDGDQNDFEDRTLLHQNRILPETEADADDATADTELSEVEQEAQTWAEDDLSAVIKDVEAIEATSEDDDQPADDTPIADLDETAVELEAVAEELSRIDRADSDAAPQDEPAAVEASEPVAVAQEEIDDSDEVEIAEPEKPTDGEPQLWQVTASHVEREVDEKTAAAHAKEVDKTSKSNFDELSRLLHERVNGKPKDAAPAPANEVAAEQPQPAEDPAPKTPEKISASEETPNPEISQINRDNAPKPKNNVEDIANHRALVALSDEALVLNKLPLGILIFKDQEILFANRAMADLAGYNTTNDLRDAGLDAILPRAEENGATFGAVTKLLRQDESEVAVVARLQTTKWYGHSAYMMTAREDQSAEAQKGIIAGSPDDLRSQMAKIANLFGLGLIELNRAGYVLDIDAEGSRVFGPSADLLRNRPILEYVSAGTRGTYLQVLSGDLDAGDVKVFAGADHCDLRLIAPDKEDDSASIFGFLSAHHVEQAEIDDQRDELNAILPILSREVRRPLATIAGFNSLMRDEAYGPIENDRYKEYVGDIQKATKQIERVISEIDDLSRLNVGDVKVSPDKIDLGLMLNKCIGRIRGQANAQRVFVRSAIPETSYMVEADEKLLTQTIMNLLASAVTLTPEGGKVVLSAIHDDHDNLMIHVRDMGDSRQNRHEEFIVYHDMDGNDALAKGNLVRSGVGLSLTQALAKANEFDLKLDRSGRAGMLMELAIPGTRVSISQN